MVSATEGTDMPVVFAAVSDPAHAGLTGFDRVTGTSDALNTPFILDMMLAVQPDVKTVGLLYSTAEPNSATAIAEAKAYLDAKGIAWLEKTGNNADEILAAAGSLTGRVEAVFTPTDNCIMAVEPAVAQIFTEAGIAHYTGADSFVAVGAFATCGVNYTQLGTQTGTMAMDILQGARIAPYHVMAGGIITVNKTTAQALGLDYAPFAQMAIELVEVE
jgi:putative ABC transport system substrate-binding protein